MTEATAEATATILTRLDEVDRRILSMIESHYVQFGCSLTPRIIADAIGHSQTLVIKRLQKLEAANLIEIRKIGSKVSNYIPRIPGRIYDEVPCPKFQAVPMAQINLNPGSAKAIEMGCRCPVLDNGHGEGALGSTPGNPLFWINSDCPLHGAGQPSRPEEAAHDAA